MVDEVNEDDFVISRRPLALCLSNGYLHRAVSIFARTMSGKFCLQRRSLHDEWLPGFWTASCTGHVKNGEDYLSASKRELREELGVETSEMKLLFKCVVPPIRFGSLIEYEIIYVLDALIEGDHVSPNSEVEEVRYFSLAELKEFFSTNADRITPDALHVFRRYLKAKKF